MKNQLMLKFVCSFFVFFLIGVNSLFSQKGEHKITLRYDFEYILNENTPIKYNVFVNLDELRFSMGNAPREITLDSICKQLDIPYHEWLSGVWLDGTPPPSFYWTNCDTIKRELRQKRTNLENEKSLYRYPEFRDYRESEYVFRIVYDSISNKYDDAPYGVNVVFDYPPSCMTLDSVTYNLSIDMPLFHYSVSSNYYGDKYFLVGFCPQIGIIYYRFPSKEIKMELKYINNIPLDCYIDNNACITPFCNIR